MSLVIDSLGSARNSSQLQRASSSPPSEIVKLQVSSGVCGVGPAESTGKSCVSYWPGGMRPLSSGLAPAAEAAGDEGHARELSLSGAAALQRGARRLAAPDEDLRRRARAGRGRARRRRASPRDVRPARPGRPPAPGSPRSARRPGSAARRAARPARRGRASRARRRRGARAGSAGRAPRRACRTEAMTTKRSAAAATIFSRVCAAPPPLTSQPSGAIWSAPSTARSSRSSSSNGSTASPSSRARVSVWSEVATQRRRRPRRASAGRKCATVEPVPSPTSIPSSTSSAAASAAQALFVLAVTPSA